MFRHSWNTGPLAGEKAFGNSKMCLPPADGESALTAENVDEESSPEQLQWYYQKTRAV
jgi:hypothetical protein